MSGTKVTFLMMAYNAEAYIEKSIRSVLEQTEKNILLCIRNNGSTDRTGEIIRSLAQEDSRIFYVENEINGLSEEGYKPFEKGWWPIREELLGEYISIIDSDDYIKCNFAEDLLKADKEHNADIIVGGNYFVDEDRKILGSRIPPKVDINGLQNGPDAFPMLYNCFRTWWGKLFNTEFFLEHYEYAWKPVQPIWWNIDTIIMVNYLQKTDKLVSIEEPYYYFLNRSTSTYRTRPMEAGRLLEAYTLYHKGMECISSLSVNTSRNRAFVESLHLAYLFESLMVYKTKKVSANERIIWIHEIINDDILKTYNRRMFSNIYNYMVPFIDDIMNASKGDLSIYKSLLVRIRYFYALYKEDQSNVMLFTILFGILCDPENRHHFGTVLRDLSFKQLSDGERFTLTFHDEIWRWWYYHPMDFIKTVYQKDNNEQFRSFKEKFIQAFESEDYKKACNFLEKATVLCPVDRDLLYYRIQLCLIIEEMDLAGVLIATARNIWQDDEAFLVLYNNI